MPRTLASESDLDQQEYQALNAMSLQYDPDLHALLEAADAISTV